MEKSVQLAALGRQDAPLAFTDYWVTRNGLVIQLSDRQPQDALPRRVPVDWPLNGN